MNKHFSGRDQNILILCLIMLSVYAVYLITVRPLRERIESVDQKKKTKERLLNNNMRLIRKANALEKTYQQYATQYKQTGSNEQIMSGILSEIEGAASSLNIKISDLKPKAVQKRDSYNQFSVSLTIESEFIDIINFIHSLQGPDHLFDVQEARFDKNINRNASAVKSSLVLTKTLIP